MTRLPSSRPTVVVIAGPNGAGKTTSAPFLLRGAFKVEEFVNADVIAQGLSGLHPERVALHAGRIMLSRLRELAAERADFAFETTLASRTFASWLSGLRQSGYDVIIFFLWLPAASMAVARVGRRVEMGGHSVPEDTIIRRHRRGPSNLFNLYMPLTTEWFFYDNSSGATPKMLARGRGRAVDEVLEPAVWESIKGQYAKE